MRDPLIEGGTGYGQALPTDTGQNTGTTYVTEPGAVGRCPSCNAATLWLKHGLRRHPMQRSSNEKGLACAYIPVSRSSVKGPCHPTWPRR